MREPVERTVSFRPFEPLDAQDLQSVLRDAEKTWQAHRTQVEKMRGYDSLQRLYAIECARMDGRDYRRFWRRALRSSGVRLNRGGRLRTTRSNSTPRQRTLALISYANYVWWNDSFIGLLQREDEDEAFEYHVNRVENRAVEIAELQRKVFRKAGAAGLDAFTVYELSGVVATYLNLQVNRRLGAAMEQAAREADQAKRAALYERLPAEVVVAAEPGMTLKELKNSVARSLEVRNRQEKPLEPLDRGAGTGSTEFERAEMRLTIEEECRRGTFTEREQEVLELHLSGLQQTEIAGELGTASGTVNNLMFRVRKKLQSRSA